MVTKQNVYKQADNADLPATLPLNPLTAVRHPYGSSPSSACWA